VRRLGRRALVCEPTWRSGLGRGDVKRAEHEFGRVDILVNKRRHGQRGRQPEIDEAAFDRMFAVHVKGSFFFTRAVIAGMKERRRGKIVNISSIWGMTGRPVASHYCAAKAALLGFTKAWQGIRAVEHPRQRGGAGGRALRRPMKPRQFEILRAKE